MSLFRQLYFWVLVAIVLGAVLGWLAPETGVALKPLGDAFIAMIKMLIGPIIFCTVVLGIAGAGDIRKAGRVGGKALLYFEAVSTLALVLGLVTVYVIRPGDGFNVNPANLDPNAVSGYVEAAAQEGVVKFLLHIIPATFTDAFTKSGNLLQVLLLAVLFGYAMTHMGSTGEIIYTFLDKVSKVFFGMMRTVMHFAPIGAGGAMAFTVGKYGMSALEPLAELIGTYYLACLLFIFVVLGTIARLAGFNIFRFLLYLKSEILTVLGTSSSETALVPLMEKLEKLGCSRSVVGLVVPAGYSFNLDGTSIYLTVATLFLAQAMNINLTLEQELTLLGVAMLTSKGASGVAGSGFITLAATLTVVPSIPVYALALILGIDRFMDEGRSVTNFIGNGVAAIVVAKWEKDIDHERLRDVMNT